MDGKMMHKVNVIPPLLAVKWVSCCTSITTFNLSYLDLFYNVCFILKCPKIRKYILGEKPKKCVHAMLYASQSSVSCDEVYAAKLRE